MRLHEEVDRPNLFVKIPATMPGLGAIEDCIAKGKSINVTLIFSLERYAAVAEAYVKGLERLVAAGGDPTQGRLGGELLRLARRHARPTGGWTRSAARRPRSRASSRSRTPSSPTGTGRRRSPAPRWEFLAAKGATTQRCLWASTSTKNPEYRDVMYVEELIGPETVNTMPAETVAAFQDHGKVVADTITEGSTRREQLLERLAEAGVDYDDVVATLEAEGVQKFADSFERAARRDPRQAQRARSGVTSDRRADLGLRRVALDRLGRGSLARLARRRHAGAARTSTS